MTVNTKKLTFEYAVFQGAYWAALGSVSGFASVFLLSRGFSSTVIGLIMALGNMGGVLLSPVVSGFADRAKKVRLHHITVIMGAIGLFLMLLLYFLPNQYIAVFALMALTITMLQTIMPFTSAVGMYYINRGVALDFGLPRGIGSISYSLMCYVMGKLVEVYSENLVMLGGVLMLALMILMLLAMPAIRQAETGEPSADADTATPEPSADWEDAQPHGFLDFFRYYPQFSVVLIGQSFIYIFHIMTNNFMMQMVTPLGGGAAEMGKAVAIAAVVELPVMAAFSRLNRRFSGSTLLIVASCGFILKGLAYLLVPSVSWLYAAQLLQMVSYALLQPAEVYYSNQMTENRDMVRGQGLMTVTCTLGGVIGNLAGGALIDACGVRTMLAFGLGMAAIGALITLLAIRLVPAKGKADSL